MALEKPVLPPSYWQDLAARNPLGTKVTEQEVRDWFEYTWPIYEHRCLEKRQRRFNHKLGIRTWWQRVTLRELQRASERAQELRDRDRLEKMTAGVDLAALDAFWDTPRVVVPPMRMGGRRGRRGAEGGDP